MRWPDKKPKEGDSRLKRRFLFIPKTIDGETRWFSYEGWWESYEREGIFDLIGATPLKWKPICWETSE